MSAEQNIDYVDQVFDKTEFPPTGRKDTRFDSCTFKHLDLTAVDFRGCDFTNCTFEHCNVSMVKFGSIGFDKVKFVDCKLVGTDFTNTKDFLFAADFSNCILDYAAFMKKKNKQSRFVNCRLKGTDFSEADLSVAIFDECDLSGAVFFRTILTGTNFTTSYNFTIDPEKNTLKKAKFSSAGLIGLLQNYGITVVN